jgi:branched-chain amino acid transport system substrate-binding protein
MRARLGRVTGGLLALALVAAACSSRDDNDNSNASTGDESGGEAAASTIDTSNCVSDPTAEIEGTELKLVNSSPQSGGAAAFAAIKTGWQAAFKKINDGGGIDVGGKTFTVTVEDKDDQYNAAQTATNMDELIGTDGENGFAAFQVVGTANNLAIRDSLNELCVPDLLAATGSPAWGNENFPWLIGATNVPYSLEAKAFADLLGDMKPDAKVAILQQDDAFGQSYTDTFQSYIEDTDITVTKVEKYASGTNDVTAQITSLAATGADALFIGGTLLACPAALNQAAANNWKPIIWVSSTCVSKTLMGAAQEKADGVYSFTNLMDVLDPEWDSNERMMQYREDIAAFDPSADTDNGLIAYGYTQALVLAEALKTAEAPTRLAVMEAMHNLEGISDVGVLLPGVTLHTAAGDNFLAESYNLIKYQYDPADPHFVLEGDVIDAEGQTAEITPDNLING